MPATTRISTATPPSTSRALRILGGPAAGQVAVPTLGKYDYRTTMSSSRALQFRYVVAHVQINDAENVAMYAEYVLIPQNTTEDAAKRLLAQAGPRTLVGPAIPSGNFADIQIEDSDMIARVGYAPKERLLRIAFHNSRREVTSTYQYENVSSQLFADILVAPSKGRFFNNHIKGIYVGTKVS